MAKVTAAFREVMGTAWVPFGVSALGWCLYTSRWRRAVARANVELHADYLGCRGSHGIHAIVRRSYDHLALVVASLLFLPRFLTRVPDLTPPPLPRRLLEQLEKGAVIFCTAHIGMWELVPHALTPALSPGCRAASAIVYQPLHNRALDRLVLARRRRCGIELVPARGSWPRLVEALEAGGIVGIVGDQRPHRGKDCARRRLLGRDVPFDDGVGRLHALTGAPVWFVVIACSGQGHRRQLVPHFVELSYGSSARGSAEASAIESECGESATHVDRCSAVMDRYAEVVSDCIVRWPEQYMWVHCRWKDLNDGELV